MVGTKRSRLGVGYPHPALHSLNKHVLNKYYWVSSSVFGRGNLDRKDIAPKKRRKQCDMRVVGMEGKGAGRPSPLRSGKAF